MLILLIKQLTYIISGLFLDFVDNSCSSIIFSLLGRLAFNLIKDWQVAKHI